MDFLLFGNNKGSIEEEVFNENSSTTQYLVADEWIFLNQDYFLKI